QPAFFKCPVVHNYEFLFNTENRALIVQLIIQSIAQNKEIISVRSLLNFIHDLIVPVQLSAISETELLDTIKHLSDSDFIKCLIPNYIFEHADLSNLFNRLSELDPCAVRTDHIDARLMKLQAADQPSMLFTDDIQPDLYTNIFDRVHIDQVDKNLVAKYYLRLLFFQHGSTPYKAIFHEYMTWLYYFNKGNLKYLNNLYTLVE